VAVVGGRVGGGGVEVDEEGSAGVAEAGGRLDSFPAPLQSIIGVSVVAAGLGTSEQWPPWLLVIRVIVMLLGGVQVKRLM
jgi:hypothetical protein